MTPSADLQEIPEASFQILYVYTVRCA